MLNSKLLVYQRLSHLQLWKSTKCFRLLPCGVIRNHAVVVTFLVSSTVSSHAVRRIVTHVTWKKAWINLGCCIVIWLVVWNMNFIFPLILGIIIPIDVHIFQRGGPTTNQILIHCWGMGEISTVRVQKGDLIRIWEATWTMGQRRKLRAAGVVPAFSRSASHWSLDTQLHKSRMMWM